MFALNVQTHFVCRQESFDCFSCLFRSAGVYFLGLGTGAQRQSAPVSGKLTAARSQFTGSDQYTGRGEAAKKAPPRLRGARWRRPAGGAFLRDLASLEDIFWVILGHSDDVGLVCETSQNTKNT